MRRVFVRFFEESSARKKTFRDYLTFNTYNVARGENADWQQCERMTDRVVFSWYVANLGAAAAGVCLRAHSQPKKTEQVAALQ